MPTRRDFLASGASAAAAGVGIGTILPAASAAHRDGEWRDKRAGTLIEFDETLLRTYQPSLAMTMDTQEAFVGLYGYVVRNDPESDLEPYDYDVCCYWSQLSIQEGLWFLSEDSHLGDHEPIYVFIDPETEEVDRVVYSAYHHYPAEVSPDSAKFRQERHPDHSTHVVLRVDERWHNYHRDPGRDGTLDYPDIDNWLDVRDHWADNGFYEHTSDEAIEDPATMLNRQAWWDEDTLDYKFAPLAHRFGLFGAGEADDLRDTDDD